MICSLFWSWMCDLTSVPMGSSGFLLWEHQEIVQRRGKGPDTFQRASHRGQGPGKVPLSVGEEAGMDSQPSELGVSTGEGPLEMPGKT